MEQATTFFEQSLVLIMWSDVRKLRFVKHGEIKTEYLITGRGRDGRAQGYDLRLHSPEQKGLRAQPILKVREIVQGLYSHEIRGEVGISPMAFDAIVRRLALQKEYLLALKNGREGWHIVGSPYGSEILFNRSQYVRDSGWEVPLERVITYSFTCNGHITPICIYTGDIEIQPIEDFLTRY